MANESDAQALANEGAAPPLNPVGAAAARYYGALGADYGSARSDGWFHALRRREQRILLELLEARRGDVVLDAGCGPGTFAAILKGRGARVWGVDLAPELVRAAAPHLERAIVADLATLDLGRTFDRVLCSGALEFTADPSAALRTLALHLRPGGIMALLVPGGPLAWIYALVRTSRGLEGHTFRRARLAGVARACGLETEKVASPALHSFVLKLRRA